MTCFWRACCSGICSAPTVMPVSSSNSFWFFENDVNQTARGEGHLDLLTLEALPVERAGGGGCNDGGLGGCRCTAPAGWSAWAAGSPSGVAPHALSARVAPTMSRCLEKITTRCLAVHCLSSLIDWNWTTLASATSS